MPFVFYDTETTGVETAFDQILQFAAIKTDDDLNELDRFDIRCRLMPYIVPSPGALRVTGMTPAMLTDPSLPSHYEAIRRVREKLTEWSPAVFIGYNSIAFDEELMRQALFQTLHPAYLTNTGGNARADVMRLVQAVTVYAPNTLSIPIGDRDQQTLRLDRLAPANGFAHDEAHEAIADVEATIHIARLVKERAPKVWSRLFSTCRKADAIRLASGDEPFALTEFYYGREYTFPVVHCGSNPDYDAQVGVFDLRHDPSPYFGMNVSQLVDALNASPKAIRTVRANAQPILMPLKAIPEEARAQFPADEVIAERVGVIRLETGFQERVGKALSDRNADREPAAHIEQRIYDGFPDRADQALMDQFQRADWQQRAEIAERLADDRVREFARRLVYVEAPGALSDKSRAAMDDWMRDRILTEDTAAPWNTVRKALRETDDLLASASGSEEALLTDVRRFLEDMAVKFGPS